MPVPSSLRRKLAQKYPRPEIDPVWLEACFDWVVEDQRLAPTQIDEILGHVDAQYLNSNLPDSIVPGTGLPPTETIAQMAKGHIAQSSTLCQIVSITDVGHSAFSLQNVRQTRIDKADMAGLAVAEGEDEEGGPPDDGEDYAIPPYPRAMLKFELSDGSSVFKAIEYRRISSLQLGVTSLGCKLLLKNVMVRRGIAFLEPSNTTVFPETRVEELDLHRDLYFARGLRVRMDLTEIDPNEANAPREMTQAAPAPGAPAPVAPVVPANLPAAPPPQVPQQRNIPRRAPQDPEAQARRHAAIKRGLSMSQQGKNQATAAAAAVVPPPSSPVVPQLPSGSYNDGLTDHSSPSPPPPPRKSRAPPPPVKDEDSFEMFVDDISFNADVIRQIEASERAATTSAPSTQTPGAGSSKLTAMSSIVEMPGPSQLSRIKRVASLVDLASDDDDDLQMILDKPSPSSKKKRKSNIGTQPPSSQLRRNDPYVLTASTKEALLQMADEVIVLSD